MLWEWNVNDMGMAWDREWESESVSNRGAGFSLQGGQNVRIVRIFFCNPKIVRIVRIFFLNCTDCTDFF